MQLSFTGVTQCTLDVEPSQFDGLAPDDVVQALYDILSEEYQGMDFEEEDVMLEAESIISARKEEQEENEPCPDCEDTDGPDDSE